MRCEADHQYEVPGSASWCMRGQQALLIVRFSRQAECSTLSLVFENEIKSNCNDLRKLSRSSANNLRVFPLAKLLIRAAVLISLAASRHWLTA